MRRGRRESVGSRPECEAGGKQIVSKRSECEGGGEISTIFGGIRRQARRVRGRRPVSRPWVWSCFRDSAGQGLVGEPAKVEILRPPSHSRPFPTDFPEKGRDSAPAQRTRRVFCNDSRTRRAFCRNRRTRRCFLQWLSTALGGPSAGERQKAHQPVILARKCSGGSSAQPPVMPGNQVPRHHRLKRGYLVTPLERGWMRTLISRGLAV